MTQYILWSGGCDSTLLLRNNAANNPNDTINAITVLGIGNGSEQQRMEKIHRNILKKKLPRNINYKTIEVKSDLVGMTWQMPQWLCHIAPCITHDDVVKMAYLSSDGKDFWMVRNDMLDAFNALMKLQGLQNTRLVFPLETYSKGYVIEELKKLKLFKYTWWCGDPKKGKACGKCMKCISVKRWTKYPQSGILT